jgi:aminopeptidase N
LLAKIDFKDLTTSMLTAQLEDSTDVVGRLLAIEHLKDRKDHDSIAQLQKTLNHDAFYGVRIEAAAALGAIHTDESLKALLASMDQSDARLRNQVSSSIAGFYNDSAFEAERAALKKEKNPDILAQHITGLGNYSKPEVRDLLLSLLQFDSYHNTIAAAAISALQAQDNPANIAPVRETLQKHEIDFPTRAFAAGLSAVGYLGRNEEKKDAELEFLLSYINNKKEGAQIGAIDALGKLEDPAAIPALATFASASKQNPAQRAAERALADIRAARKPTDNLKEIRDTILDLQKENHKLRAELDALEKKVAAKSKK